jgi:anti-sigma B factor antagonist
MEINLKTVEGITIVEIDSDIDEKTAPQIQEQVSPLIQLDCKIILNMTKVYYMSSAGLRLIMTIYRQVSDNNGQILLVGLSTSIKMTMSTTGFLRFLAVYDTVEAGLAALQE